MKKNKVCIIGIGKVGSALAIELAAAGFNVKYLVGTDEKILKKVSKRIKKVVTSSEINEKIINKSDVIFITVQDSKIDEIVSAIRALKQDLSGKIFIHTSGAVSSRELNPLQAGKDNIASFHPIQTFSYVSNKNDHLLSGIYFGIEGGDEAKKFLAKAAKKLRSNVIEIPTIKKPLYHAASVIASNLLVTNINIISDILVKLGVKDVNAYDIYKGIIHQTIKNMEKHGEAEALTGPVERNDTETILSHIEYLRKYLPGVESFYKEASKMTSKVALKKGSLTKKQFDELNRLLSKRK